MSEIEHVAKAMADAVAMNYDNNEAIFTLYARTAIASLDALRTAEKRKNCKHHNRTGTGYAGGDGTGWTTWYCQSCGASYDSRSNTPAVGKSEA